MTIHAIKENLHSFIDTANDKQLEELYIFIANKFADKHDWWEDDEFVAELEQRIKDFESGKTKGFTWEEVKLKAKSRLAVTKN
jgi:putative addiction module component (TIGR02574 family)